MAPVYQTIRHSGNSPLIRAGAPPKSAGQTLTLSLDGVVKATATDATFSSGPVGLVIQSGGATSQHRADNFLATTP